VATVSSPMEAGKGSRLLRAGEFTGTSPSTTWPVVPSVPNRYPGRSTGWPGPWSSGYDSMISATPSPVG
jgi:hypothetical protein